MFTPRQTDTNIYTHLITLSKKSLDHPYLFNKQKIAFTIFFSDCANQRNWEMNYGNNNKGHNPATLTHS